MGVSNSTIMKEQHIATFCIQFISHAINETYTQAYSKMFLFLYET